MFVQKRQCMLSIIILILIATQSLAQQPKRQSNRAFVEAKLERFTKYLEDFTAFRESLSDDSGEYLIAESFHDAAEDVGEYLIASLTLVEIYNSLSCERDRARVKQLLKRQFDYNARQLDSKINPVNLGLSSTKDGHSLAYYHRGLAKSGDQLRNDLLEIKSFFESISF